MDIKEERICRLCLEIINSDFEVIEESTREMFDFLLLNVNLSVCNDPIMCEKCADILQKSFDFKSACMDVENRMTSFTTAESDALKDLKELHLNEDETTNTEIVQCNKCHFCVQSVNIDECTSLNKVKEHVALAEHFLSKCFPEINSLDTKDAVACTSCVESLVNCLTFVMNCWNVEESIQLFCESQAANSKDQVNLNDVLQFMASEHGVTGSYNCSTEGEDLFLKEKKDRGIKIEDAMKVEQEFDIKLEDVDINVKQNNLDSSQAQVLSVYPEEKPEISYDHISKTTTGVCEFSASEQKPNSYGISSNTSIAEVPTYECKMCPFKSKYRSSIKVHMLTHKNRTEIAMFKCGACMHESKRKCDLLRHIQTHNKSSAVPSKTPLYKCELCTFKTKYSRSIRRHMITHKDPSELTMYKCEICAHETKWKEQFAYHMLLHKNRSQIESYKCDRCSFKTIRKCYLKAHVLIHGDPLYKCKICTFQSKHKPSYTRHMIVHKDRSDLNLYKCQMCSYETIKEVYLRRHMDIHKNPSERASYRCEICTFETARKYYLSVHMRIHNTSETRYKCDLCIYETIWKSAFKNHMLTHSNGRRPPKMEQQVYKCTMCAHETQKKNHLNTHMRIHKDPTYKCNICTFVTRHPFSLKCHMLTHQDPSERALYKCEICAFETKQKITLKRHMVIHENLPTPNK